MERYAVVLTTGAVDLIAWNLKLLQHDSGYADANNERESMSALFTAIGASVARVKATIVGEQTKNAKSNIPSKNEFGINGLISATGASESLTIRRI